MMMFLYKDSKEKKKKEKQKRRKLITMTIPLVKVPITKQTDGFMNL